MNILLRQLYSTFPINIIIPMLLILSLSVHDNLVKKKRNKITCYTVIYVHGTNTCIKYIRMTIDAEISKRLGYDLPTNLRHMYHRSSNYTKSRETKLDRQY